MTSCFQSFEPPLRAFLTRQTQSVEDAEDLSQEVFLRLWRLGGSHEIRHLKAFIFTTANNLLRDRSRRNYARIMRQSVPAAEVELLDVGSEPSGLVESLQTLAAFDGVLRGLRASTRTAFVLYRLEARPQVEIAAHLGISVSMVEKHISYAMAALHSAGIKIY